MVNLLLTFDNRKQCPLLNEKSVTTFCCGVVIVVVVIVDMWVTSALSTYPQSSASQLVAVSVDSATCRISLAKPGVEFVTLKVLQLEHQHHLLEINKKWLTCGLRGSDRWDLINLSSMTLAKTVALAGKLQNMAVMGKSVE